MTCDPIIAEIEKKMEKEKAVLEKLGRALGALQDICEHEWHPDGNDSHKDYEKCVKCHATREA